VGGQRRELDRRCCALRATLGFPNGCQRRAKWGAVGLQSARTIQGYDETDLHRYMVWYDGTQISQSDLLAFVQTLDPNGTVSQSPDFFEVVVDRTTLFGEVATAVFVNKIVTADPSEVVSLGVGSSSAALTSNSDDAYASRSIFGNKVKVGMVEIDGGDNCGIYDDHEAFSNLTTHIGPPPDLLTERVTYRFPPKRCDTNGPSYTCNCYEGTGVPGRCIPDGGPEGADGHCVGVHETEVASNISASMAGTPHHAAKVDLYLAQNGTGDAGQLSGTYAWFLEDNKNVRLVNESYAHGGFGGYFDHRAQVSDWYARHQRMTFVQGAGNVWWKRTVEQDPVPDEYLVFPTGFNSLSVGASDSDDGNHDGDRLWGQLEGKLGSCWMNPVEAVELEKPDFVAKGEDAAVASVLNPTAWMLGDGTSYAAPNTVGTLALFTEDCGGGEPYQPEHIRAIMRTSAWSAHYVLEEPFFCESRGQVAPWGLSSCLLGTKLRHEAGNVASCIDEACYEVPFYPTPGYTNPTTGKPFDAKAGVGIVDDRHLPLWCHSGPGECGLTPEEPCVVSGSGDMERGDPLWEGPLIDVAPWMTTPFTGVVVDSPPLDSRVRPLVLNQAHIFS